MRLSDQFTIAKIPKGTMLFRHAPTKVIKNGSAIFGLSINAAKNSSCKSQFMQTWITENDISIPLLTKQEDGKEVSTIRETLFYFVSSTPPLMSLDTIKMLGFHSGHLAMILFNKGMPGWMSCTDSPGEYEICLYGIKVAQGIVKYKDRFPISSNHYRGENFFSKVKLFAPGELSKPERAPVEVACDSSYMASGIRVEQGKNDFPF